jgi:hypothetical protein
MLGHASPGDPFGRVDIAIGNQGFAQASDDSKNFLAFLHSSVTVEP